MENNKNLWVIPTDKPSRLSKSTSKEELTFCSDIDNLSNNQHIYITSDEIVTEYSTDLYFIDVYTNTRHIFSPIYIDKDTIAAGKFHTYMNDGSMCKKIILTTDPSLAPDVQKIPDEFLEWFVKNPSCEEVEVEKIYDKLYVPIEQLMQYESQPKEMQFEHSSNIDECYYYKIIIPKEEPKQETLEEAAERLLNLNELDSFRDYHYKQELYNAFIVGIKYQQERMYTEEDVKNAFLDGWQLRDGDLPFPKAKKKWFNEFKKE